MERKLQERMVGAGVLILALVIVGPMILDGGSGGGDDAAEIPGQRPDEIHSQTFRLNEPVVRATSDVSPATAPPAPAATAPPADSPSAAPPPPAQPAIARAESAAPAPRPLATAPVPATAPLPRRDPGKVAAEPEPVAASASKSGGGFLVQVGTFGQKDNAERLVGTLKGRGFAAFVSPLTRSGKTLYRVRVGPPATREVAGELAGQLAAAGQGGQVVAQ